MGGNLIFIVSQPRAGSTMLQKMLGSHPLVHTESEPWIALHPLFALRRRGIAADYSASLAHEGLSQFLNGLPEKEDAYFEAVRRMLGYLYDRKLQVAGKHVFLDKTPRYYFIASELRRLFPEARFVYLVRNPIAVFVSILETFCASDHPGFLWAHRPDFFRAPPLLLEAIKSPAARSSVVRYEQLTAAPEREMTRVCHEIDLPYDNAIIEYGASETGKRTFYFGDPETVYRESRPVSDRTDRWRTVLRDHPIWAGWTACYLRDLGRETVEAMQYDYDELARELPERPEFLEEWRAATSAPPRA